jgi:oleate hydratase
MPGRHEDSGPVYRLLGVDRPIPPIYHGLLDPKAGVKALEAAFR